MKRTALITAAAVTAALAVAGCGSSSSTKTTPTSSTPAVTTPAAPAPDPAKLLQQTMLSTSKSALQKAILKDARQSVSDGVLDGPIKSVSCAPATSTDSADAHQAAFSCIAVNKTGSDGTEEGYSYTGTANYDTGDITWHLGRV